MRRRGPRVCVAQDGQDEEGEEAVGGDGEESPEHDDVDEASEQPCARSGEVRENVGIREEDQLADDLVWSGRGAGVGGWGRRSENCELWD